ncbi:unnamed protein product [Laminaria digitata]
MAIIQAGRGSGGWGGVSKGPHKFPPTLKSPTTASLATGLILFLIFLARRTYGTYENTSWREIVFVQDPAKGRKADFFRQSGRQTTRLGLFPAVRTYLVRIWLIHVVRLRNR